MEKTGRRNIRPSFKHKGLPDCTNCGGKGKYKVIYEDMYGKLVVTLCEECEKLEYEELKLQARFDWEKMVYP